LEGTHLKHKRFKSKRQVIFISNQKLKPTFMGARSSKNLLDSTKTTMKDDAAVLKGLGEVLHTLQEGISTLIFFSVFFMHIIRKHFRMQKNSTARHD